MNETTPSRIDRVMMIAGAIAVCAGFVLSLIGIPMAGGAKGLAQSYFFAFASVATLTIGFFGLTLLHHTTRARWGFPVLRIVEAGGGWRQILFVALAWIPVAFVWREALYPWSNPEVVASDPILQAKTPYLNDARWIGFSLFAFAFMAWMSYRNSLWQRKEDETGDKRWRDLRTNWSSPGLVAFFLIGNFLYTDWVMSQDPHWSSTMYGILFVVGGMLAALALTTLVFCSQTNKAPFARVTEPWLTNDLGNMLLTGTMIWAYFAFSQYLIIWSGHLPEYIPYWLRRSNNGWHWLGNTLIVTQFFIPFLLLLIPKVKRVPALLGTVAGWILLMRFLDFQYIVVPTYREQMAFQPLDLGLLLLLLGLWAINFGNSLGQSALIVDRLPKGHVQEPVTDHA